MGLHCLMKVVSVYAHEGYTMETLYTHTHTQLHLFDRVDLRCLPADLVVEEETVGGFLACLRCGGMCVFCIKGGHA